MPKESWMLGVWMVPRTFISTIFFLNRHTRLNIDKKSLMVPVFVLAMAVVGYGYERERSSIRYLGVFERFFEEN